MKITPDNLSRLKEAAKILSSLPFSVVMDTILEKPKVQLFLDRDEFTENFPNCKTETAEHGIFFEAEQDGVRFLCYEEKAHD